MLEYRESEREREIEPFLWGEVSRNMKWVTCVNRGLCMCLMLSVSPGEGQNIQYYQIKTTHLKE